MIELNSSFEPPEDSLTSMLLQKEKELQQLSKMRINQLQDQIMYKDKTIFDLESQIRRLQDDLTYNQSLVQQRDEEIADLESSLSSYIEENNSYANENSALKADLKNYQMKLEKSEEFISELNGSREVCNEFQHKLQEAYSQLSKIKYEEQFNQEKYKEIEMNSQELTNINFQYLEDIKEKDFTINKLLQENQNLERDKNEFNLRLKNERDKYEREINTVKSKYANEIRQIKDIKESSNENISFNFKQQIEKLQVQVKTLLEDNKKSNKQVEYYQNLLLEKERDLTQEIFDLRKEITFNLQQIEELRANNRTKDMEIESIKEHIDHWKTLAQNRADELFKFKQLQIRSEEKAENYLKELDSLRTENFEEIQRLKKDNENLLHERKQKFGTDQDHSKKVLEMKAEIERLNDFIYNKDKENHRLSTLIDTLKREKGENTEKHELYEKTTSKNVSFKETSGKDSKLKPRPIRDSSYGVTNRSKIYQVKSNLDKKFLECVRP